jgi:hypothetical protein
MPLSLPAGGRRPTESGKRHTLGLMLGAGTASTRFLGIALAVALCASVCAAGAARPARSGGSAGIEKLKAFQRPATARDALHRGRLGPLKRQFGRVVASRRIATTSGFRGAAALYLVRLSRDYTCLIQIEINGGEGAGCSPSREFLSATRRVNAGSGDGFFNGVAGNEIARVAFVDRRGRLRPVRLTRDGGFLYVCRNRNGCVDVIKAVNGYDRSGRLVSHQVW